MKAETLADKVRNATPEEQKLIAQILEAPESLKHSVSEALSEVKKKSRLIRLLQCVVDTTVEVSKEVNIATNSDAHLEGFEMMIKAFTQPEAIKALAPKDPLAAARFKGMQIKLELLYECSQPLKSEEVAQLLHITRQAVDKRRSKGQLLAISLGRRGYFYPAWQFHEGKVLPGLELVMATLKEYDPWTQLMFFKTGDIRLEGATPLERLRTGNVDKVVWAAQCYGKHGAA